MSKSENVFTFADELEYKRIPIGSTAQLQSESLTTTEVTGPLTDAQIEVSFSRGQTYFGRTDSQGKVRIDMRPYADKIAMGERLDVTARLLGAADAPVVTKAFTSSELGVTWATPRSYEKSQTMLVADTVLRDENNNGIVEPNESGRFEITVRNIGETDAYNVGIKCSSSVGEGTWIPSLFSQPESRLARGASFTRNIAFQTPKDFVLPQATFVFTATPIDLSGTVHQQVVLSVKLRSLVPAQLDIALDFRDATNDGTLGFGEAATATLTVINKGDARVLDLRPNWELPSATPQLTIRTLDPDPPAIMEPGARWTQRIQFTTADEWVWNSSDLSLGIQMTEQSGATHSTPRRSLKVASFQPPSLKIASWIWDDVENKTLEPGDDITLVITVRNEGKTPARAVRLRAESNNQELARTINHRINSPVVIQPGGESIYRIATMVPRSIGSNAGTLVPMTVAIEEERERYSVPAQGLDLRIGAKADGEIRVREAIAAAPNPNTNPVSSDGPAAAIRPLTPAELADIRSRNYALLIGINRYDDSNINTLKFAVPDARRMYETLTDRDFGVYDPDKVFLLTTDELKAENRPTYANTMDVMDKILQRISSGDRFLLYFAGHGEAEGDQTYLVLQDTRINRLQKTGINLRSEILEQIRSKGPKESIVIIDSCHSGGMLAGTRTGAGIRSVGKLQRSVLESVTFDGYVAMASTGADQFSYEHPEIGHGVYTWFLTEGLRPSSGRVLKADFNQDGRVSATELHRFTSDSVKEWCQKTGKPGSQIPDIITRSEGGEIPLAISGIR